MEKKIITVGNDPINEVKNANGTTMTGNDETNEWRNVTNPFLGLTKREYFAAMALQGILASNPNYLWGNVDRPIPASVAAEATQYADALITSLNQ